MLLSKNMISQLKREELARIILSTEDEELLDQLREIIDRENSYNNLPEKVKNDIEASLREIEAGLGIPHSQVMAQYKKWL